MSEIEDIAHVEFDEPEDNLDKLDIVESHIDGRTHWRNCWASSRLISACVGNMLSTLGMPHPSWEV